MYSGGEIIGDGIYKLPVIRALRSAFPAARITWVCPGTTVYSDRLAPLVAGLLDEVRAQAPVGRHPGDLLRRVRTEDRFELVLDTQHIVWRTLCARRLARETFVSGAFGFRLSDVRPSDGYRRPRHIVAQLIDLIGLATAHRPPLDRRLCLPVTHADKARALLPEGSTYVGFAPGAGGASKRWPLDRFIEVAARQAARGRVPVFILGPAEAGELPAIRTALPTAVFPEQEEAVWGRGFDPLRTMAIGGRLTAAVTNDSGISHMLAAVDTPLAVLYGHTSAEKFGPITPRACFLKAADYGDRRMESIPVDAVDHALEALVTSAMPSGVPAPLIIQ